MKIEITKPFGLAAVGQVLDMAKPVAELLVGRGRAKLVEGAANCQSSGQGKPKGKPTKGR